MLVPGVHQPDMQPIDELRVRRQARQTVRIQPQQRLAVAHVGGTEPKTFLHLFEALFQILQSLGSPCCGHSDRGNKRNSTLLGL
jgi:hypothetical protein